MELNEDLPALPKGWVWTRLVEVSELILGQSPPSSTYNENHKGIPFYQGKLEFGDIYPSPRKWCSSPKKIAEKNDILLSVRAPVGPTNICPEKSCIGRGLAAIRPMCGIESIFILYLMRVYENNLAKLGTGTTFKAITGNLLKDFKIPLPPLPEQHRIVNKIEELFTKLDAGVDALKKIKIQLKRYRQAVLKNAFEGKLTQQWREAHKEELEPASVLLEKIKEQRKKEFKGKFKELPPVDTSELPELPEGWVWTRVDCITQNITKGSTPTSYGFSYKKEGIKFIKTENIIEDGTIANIKDFIDEDANNFLKRSILQTNDILFSIAGTIGRVGLVQERDLPANTNQALSLIRLFSENIVNKYVFYFFKSPYIQKQSLKSIVGVGRANITLSDVSNYNIPLPPLPEQQQIVAEIERRLSVADQLEKVVEQSLKQAERLRQSILKHAFEGKLVPQDPTDEPAEKLLERIKEEKESRGITKQKSGKRK